jgi:hypothetical protein
MFALVTGTLHRDPIARAAERPRDAGQRAL